jgi:hypothetical protein
VEVVEEKEDREIDEDVDEDVDVDVEEVGPPCSAVNDVVVSGTVEEATSEGGFSMALVMSTTSPLDREMSGILELAYGGTTLLKVGGAVVESPDVEDNTVGKVDSGSDVVDALEDAPSVDEGHTVEKVNSGIDVLDAVEGAPSVDEGDTVGKVDSVSDVLDVLDGAPNVDEGDTVGKVDSGSDVVDAPNVDEGDIVGEEESVNGVVGSLENEEELAIAVKSSVVVVRARACATRNKIGSESIFVNVLITIQTLR